MYEALSITIYVAFYLLIGAACAGALFAVLCESRSKAEMMKVSAWVFVLAMLFWPVMIAGFVGLCVVALIQKIAS